MFISLFFFFFTWFLCTLSACKHIKSRKNLPIEKWKKNHRQVGGGKTRLYVTKLEKIYIKKTKTSATYWQWLRMMPETEKVRKSEKEKHQRDRYRMRRKEICVLVMKMMDDTHGTANCNNYSRGKLRHTLYNQIYPDHMRVLPFIWPISRESSSWLEHPLRLYSNAFLWCLGISES